MRGQKGGRPMKMCIVREMWCGSHRREQRVVGGCKKCWSRSRVRWRCREGWRGLRDGSKAARESPTRNKLKTFPQSSARCFWQSCWLVSVGVHDTVCGICILPWIQLRWGKLCQSEWLFIPDWLQETEKGGVFTTFCHNSQDGRVTERETPLRKVNFGLC